MSQDIEKIRHYKGTVADFKNFFDQKAAETAKETDEKMNTNAYGTPEYQGFDDVHPTRGANASPHWKESNLQEKDKNENPFEPGQKVVVDKIVGTTHTKQSDARRFNGKKGTVIGTQGNYVYVDLKGFKSPNIEFATHELKLDESVNEDKEVTQEMWDKDWKINRTFGKEYTEHFNMRMRAAMSKAKDEEMAENWAYINWKQLPGKADGMTIKESVNEAVPSQEDYHSKDKLDILFTLEGPHNKSLQTSRAIYKDVEKHGIIFDEFFDNDKGNESGEFLISFPASVNNVQGAGKKEIIRLVGNRGTLVERPNWVNENFNSTSTTVDRLPLFEDFQG